MRGVPLNLDWLGLGSQPGYMVEQEQFVRDAMEKCIVTNSVPSDGLLNSKNI